MNRPIILSLTITLFILNSACSNKHEIVGKRAKAESDEILTRIADGTANDFFKPPQFDPQQTASLMDGLKNGCQFSSRQGGFVNAYYQTDSGVDIISEIYEFKLKCGNLRFIFSYNVGNDNVLELRQCRIEDARKPNPMVYH